MFPPLIRSFGADTLRQYVLLVKSSPLLIHMISTLLGWWWWWWCFAFQPRPNDIRPVGLPLIVFDCAVHVWQFQWFSAQHRVHFFSCGTFLAALRPVFVRLRSVKTISVAIIIKLVCRPLCVPGWCVVWLAAIWMHYNYASVHVTIVQCFAPKNMVKYTHTIDSNR